MTNDKLKKRRKPLTPAQKELEKQRRAQRKKAKDEWKKTQLPLWPPSNTQR